MFPQINGFYICVNNFTKLLQAKILYFFNGTSIVFVYTQESKLYYVKKLMRNISIVMITGCLLIKFWRGKLESKQKAKY